MLLTDDAEHGLIVLLSVSAVDRSFVYLCEQTDGFGKQMSRKFCHSETLPQAKITRF